MIQHLDMFHQIFMATWLHRKDLKDRDYRNSAPGAAAELFGPWGWGTSTCISFFLHKLTTAKHKSLLGCHEICAFPFPCGSCVLISLQLLQQYRDGFWMLIRHSFMLKQDFMADIFILQMRTLKLKFSWKYQDTKALSSHHFIIKCNLTSFYFSQLKQWITHAGKTVSWSVLIMGQNNRCCFPIFFHKIVLNNYFLFGVNSHELFTHSQL